MANKVDFHFNVGERLHYAARVVRKSRSLGLMSAVYCTDRRRTEAFVTTLCAFDPTGFYPIVPANDPLAPVTGTVYANRLEELPDRDVLILLDEQVPADFVDQFARFERIIDIVSAEPEPLEAARARFSLYRHSSIEPVAHKQGHSHEH